MHMARPRGEHETFCLQRANAFPVTHLDRTDFECCEATTEALRIPRE